MKPQIILTSYIRPKYLIPTVESLRQDDVELYIVDGGSNDETVKFIKQNSNGCLLFKNNPGADFLKTEGIKKFVTNDRFIITSDDLVFSKGYSKQLMESHDKLNLDGLKWDFVACGKTRHRKEPWCNHFITVNGVGVMPVRYGQVAGAVITTELCKSVGYFPLCGKSGQGDLAYSTFMKNKGIKIGYFQDILIEDIGRFKFRDYPEYTRNFQADEAIHVPKAKAIGV